MQYLALRHRARLRHALQQRRLRRGFGTDDIRLDHILQQILDRHVCGIARLRPPIEQLGKIGERARLRDHRTARQAVALRFLLGRPLRLPFGQLLGRGRKPGFAADPLLQISHCLEQLNLFENLIGVKIIHTLDRELDRAFAADIERGLDVQPCDHLVDIIDIDPDRFTASQIAADFEPSTIGPAGEIAEHCEAEGRPDRNLPLPMTSADKTEIQFHSHLPCVATTRQQAAGRRPNRNGTRRSPQRHGLV